MTVYRANYGDAFYGQDIYGLSGSVIDATASITPICSVSSSAVRVREALSSDTSSCSVVAAMQQVKLGAANVTCAASTSAGSNVITDAAAALTCTSSTSTTAIKVITAAADIVCQGVVVAVAVEYPEEEGFRPGYGLNTYGTYIYGVNHSVEEGAASINLTCSVSNSAVKVVSAASNVSLASTVTGNGVIDVVGRADVALSSVVNISYNRVRTMSATDNLSLIVNVLSRYKWLDADEPTTAWTEAPNPSNTWTEADYLERAA